MIMSNWQFIVRALLAFIPVVIVYHFWGLHGVAIGTAIVYDVLAAVYACIFCLHEITQIGKIIKIPFSYVLMQQLDKEALPTKVHTVISTFIASAYVWNMVREGFMVSAIVGGLFCLFINVTVWLKNNEYEF